MILEDRESGRLARGRHSLPDGSERLGLGEQISIRNTFSTEGGLATVNGKGFSLNSVIGNAAFQLIVTAEPITLPSNLNSSLTLQAATSLTTLFLDEQRGELQLHPIFGSGTANANFLEFDEDYRFTGLQVTFLPAIPEPGTLLLGSGLLGLGDWRAAKRENAFAPS